MNQSRTQRNDLVVFQYNKRQRNQEAEQVTSTHVATGPLLVLFSLLLVSLPFLAFPLSQLVAQTKNQETTAAKPLFETRIKSFLASGAVRNFRFTDSLQVPDKVSFRDELGKTRLLKEWRGKTILLNFWAPWCEPCRKELPSMQHLRLRLDQQDFEIIALNIDNDVKRGRAYLDRLGIKNILSMVDTDKAAFKQLAAIGIPTSILFDCKGRELGRLKGSAVWNADAAILLVKSLMRASGCYDEEREKL